MSSHTPSDFIISKIKEFEGNYLTSYYCPAGVLTIGYGITNADYEITGTKITENMTISQATADEWLKKSLIKKYAPKVDKYNNIYHWNQNQFDALLSFTYNIGSIDELTNHGNNSIQKISNDILLYIHAGKKVLNGLVRRRRFEKELFDTPDQNLITIAKEVIQGKWGNGIERKTNLEKAGYNYNQVQSIVNDLLK